MQNQIKVIDNIMSVPAIKRRKLRRDAQRHAERQCNGEYYYCEDTGAFSDPRAEKLEQSIIKRLCEFSSGIIGEVTSRYVEYPDFITFDNDPRGFVLKIEAEKLTDEAKQHCRDIRLAQDWGGDYTILFNNELQD